MNKVLIVMFGVTITPWKLIGYLGVFLFAGLGTLLILWGTVWRKARPA